MNGFLSHSLMGVLSRALWQIYHVPVLHRSCKGQEVVMTTGLINMSCGSLV